MSAVLNEHGPAIVGSDKRSGLPAWLVEVCDEWSDVLENPSLRDLPYKIETNRSGQIIMSPAKTLHSVFQAKLSALIDQALGNVVLTECAIATREGVKVADVAWCSVERYREIRGPGVLLIAPELCIEIRSPSNALPELMAKVRLYLDSGAREVWLVADDGVILMHDLSGPIAKSSFALEVPTLTEP